jgi:hypothetical protein
MADLPEVREKFVADTSGYSARLREAARDADKFGEKNSEAALAARKMGLAAKDAADKAARAMSKAGEAAEKLAMGEIKADEAAQAEADALREVERAAIKAAEAERAVGKAADQAADQMRQLARDAELAGAAQRLASLKAGGAVKTHNALLKQLEGRFGDLSKEGSGAFQEIEKSGTSAFESIGSSGPGAIILVTAALAAVPFAAVAAEGAITLGLGGALAGLGLAATKSDSQVQAALHGMTSHVKSMTAQIAAPFKQTWLDIADSATQAFDGLVPSLTSAFAKLAPAVSRFSHDAGYALTQLGPAFDAAASGASTLMGELGPKLPEITRNLGSSIKIMANSAADAAPEFANVATAASQMLPPLAHALDLAVKLGPTFNLAFGAISGGATTVSSFRGGLETLTGGLISANHALQIGGGEFPTFAQKAAIAAVATNHVMSAQQAAVMSSNQLANALKGLTSATQGAFDAETSYRQALVAANAQARQSNAGINGMGKAALANRGALSSLAGAIKNVMTTAHPTAAAIESMRQRFVSAAVGMGVNRRAAEALATKLLGVTKATNSIPSAKSTRLSNNAAAARAAVQAYQNKLDSLHGKTVYIRTVYTVAGTTFGKGNRKLGAAATGGFIHRAVGGPVQHLDSGGPSGPVFGPGTGTSDSIPALLSNGEYVINAKQTEKYRPLLDAINYKLDGFADGGFAKGGKAKKPTAAQKKAASARLTAARSRPEYLAALAAQQSLASMRASIYGGFARGGRPGIGSNGSTVVQHVTTINVNVAGSVRADYDLAHTVANVIVQNRIPVSLPVGR